MKFTASIYSYIITLLLGIGLTLGSIQYVRPANCQTICDEPEQAPCPSGSCRFGEQRAGFPLPVMIDSGAGSSPTVGWGKLGPEDLPNPVTFVLDVLFYSVLLWLIRQVIRVLLGKEKPRDLLAMLPMLDLVLACLMVGFLSDRSLSGRSSLITTGGPEAAILGKWNATDISSGKGFSFRFYEGGRFSTTLPGYSGQGEGEYRWGGEYQWEGESTIRMTFDWAGEHIEGDGGICAVAPSFLKDLCHSKVVDPASYPGPAEVPYTTYPGLYPAPSPEPRTYSSIDEGFQVGLEGDTLTLTPPSGAAQIFRRVTGE